MTDDERDLLEELAMLKAHAAARTEQPTDATLLVTDAMIEAGRIAGPTHILEDVSDWQMEAIYLAMQAAAPTPNEEGVPPEVAIWAAYDKAEAPDSEGLVEKAIRAAKAAMTPIDCKDEDGVGFVALTNVEAGVRAALEAVRAGDGR